MTKYTHTCEKCGKESEASDRSATPEGWEDVFISAGITSSYHQGRFSKTYELCPECIAKLGIPPKEVKTDPAQDKSTADRLYDIMCEIAHESGCNR